MAYTCPYVAACLQQYSNTLVFEQFIFYGIDEPFALPCTLSRIIHKKNNDILGICPIGSTELKYNLCNTSHLNPNNPEHVVSTSPSSENSFRCSVCFRTHLEAKEIQN